MSAPDPAVRFVLVPEPPPPRSLHVSASQVKTYQACPRKWWYEKVAGYRTGSTTAQAFGTMIHGQMETWLQGGAEPEHPVARAGMVLCPSPSPDLGIEVEMLPALTLAGVPWVGRIDLLAPPLGDLGPLVLDHKTTSDYRYCKTASDLRTDPQMVSYACFASEKFYGPSARTRSRPVRLAHVYYHSRPEKLPASTSRARRVDTTLESWQAWEVFTSFTPTVESMKADWLKGSALDVEPDFDACHDYGGCPHRAICNATRNPMTTPTNPLAPRSVASLLSLPRKPLAAAPAPAQAAQPAQPAQPAQTAQAARLEAPEAEGLALFIDCVPTNGYPDAQPIESLVAAHAGPICTAQGVPDLRVIGYGQGPGFLAASLRAEPPVGAFYGSSTSGLNAHAFDALIPSATVVVRGMR